MPKHHLLHVGTIVWLTVAGLLAQAMALGWHGGLGPSAQPAAVADLARDLRTTICHPAGLALDAGTRGGEAPSDAPAPNPQHTNCPACTGTVAIDTPPAPTFACRVIAQDRATHAWHIFAERHRIQRFVRPQGRGPPPLV